MTVNDEVLSLTLFLCVCLTPPMSLSLSLSLSVCLSSSLSLSHRERERERETHKHRRSLTHTHTHNAVETENVMRSMTQSLLARDWQQWLAACTRSWLMEFRCWDSLGCHCTWGPFQGIVGPHLSLCVVCLQLDVTASVDGGRPRTFVKLTVLLSKHTKGWGCTPF